MVDLVPLLKSRYRYYVGDMELGLLGRIPLCLWLLFSSIFLREKLAGVSAWKMPEVYLPQIDITHIKGLDPLRVIVQLAWLFFFKASTPGRSESTPSALDELRGKTDAWVDNISHAFNGFSRRVRVQFQREAQRRGLRQMPWQEVDKKGGRLRGGLMIVLTLAIGFLCVTVPLDPMQQFFFGATLFILLLILNRIPGRFPGMLMMVLSLLASCRYIWWRATSTLNYDDPLGLTLGIGLLLAELYAWVVLVLGFYQNVWPLKRPATKLPDDERTWPTVDLFIPTYNEELDVVRATVYAAQGLDWPEDKLKIFILDDGKRDEFRDFVAEVGVGYVRRPDNSHAKAGNINYALKQTDGEFVAIFDCDHIPTRAFLQISMGWFLRDPKLALVQTPHHFFSPDPFERNLENFREVPNEGGLFYGLIQDGSDLWNGTFFCGSCAVIRREPLEEVGGIAVETVTEDAHTSLRMHRLGYNSAYIRAPVAAGLATETLSAHIGQRIRWARGMAQILRTDNPLTGKGLKWRQRLCYFNSMLHFMSGIPRIVFLTAPLAFLLLHTYIIYAPAVMILLYVFPHMLYSSVVNARIQGKYRHSLWGEVYETVLSWYVARPTTVAMFAPHKGTFNVTAKGGLIEEKYFDWVMSKPYILLVVLNIAGLAVGVWRLLEGPSDEVNSVLMNLFWATYNLVILGGAVAVAGEMKQVRRDHRVSVRLPASVRLKNGTLLNAEVADFSLGGLRVELSPEAAEMMERDVSVIMERAGREFVFPMHVAFKGRTSVGLQLRDKSPTTMVNYVQCTFARADNWVRWKQGMAPDKPLSSLRMIIHVSILGYSRLVNGLLEPLKQSSGSLFNTFTTLKSLRPQPISMRADDL